MISMILFSVYVSHEQCITCALVFLGFRFLCFICVMCYVSVSVYLVLRIRF